MYKDTRYARRSPVAARYRASGMRYRDYQTQVLDMRRYRGLRAPPATPDSLLRSITRRLLFLPPLPPSPPPPRPAREVHVAILMIGDALSFDIFSRIDRSRGAPRLCADRFDRSESFYTREAKVLPRHRSATISRKATGLCLACRRGIVWRENVEIPHDICSSCPTSRLANAATG
jgi:hypothetical protein